MNENNERLFLCKPCAEKLKGFKSVKSVKYLAPHKEKGTCDQCGCRRYGYDCEVEWSDVAYGEE